MSKHNFLSTVKNGLRRPFLYRQVKSQVFSGRPVIDEILLTGEEESYATMSIRYRNGLLLTIGGGGIMDFQDRKYADFMENEGFSRLDFLVHLHKIVLKSLLKFMIHPGTTVGQRERAAAAISNLWLAESQPPPSLRSSSEKVLIPF